jgi:hypothetical protein
MGTFIPIHLACRLRCRLSRATASCDLRGPAPPTSRWGALPASSCSPGVVQRSPLHRFPCRSPRAGQRPDACAPFRCLPGRGCLGACAPPALGADLVVWLRPRRFLPPAGCRGIAPGADPGVRLVSPCLGSRLGSAPRADFPPFEALFPEGSCPARSRVPCGGSSGACGWLITRVRFTEPLAASPFAVAGGGLAALLLPRSCTFRCALPRAEPPLLPWV